MIERVVESLKVMYRDPEFIFVVESKTAKNSHWIKHYACWVRALKLFKKTVTLPALCAHYLAVDQLDLQRPLLISNCDTLIAGITAQQIIKLTHKRNAASILL